MMHAYISGQAAKVVFVEGNEVSYVDAEEPENTVISSLNEIGLVLSGASDIEILEVQNRKDVYERFFQKYHLDRSLQLLDIALTKAGNSEISIEAADCFSELTKDDQILKEVEKYAFSTENENAVFSNLERVQFSSSPQFQGFLKKLAEHQIHIMNVEERLQRAFANNKLDQSTAEDFKCAAIFEGIFSELVLARGDGEKVEDIVLNGYLKLARIPSSRKIISDWTRDFLSKSAKKSLKEIEKDQLAFDEENSIGNSQREMGIHEIFQAVQTQIQAIAQRLRAGDKSTARKFASQLVRKQLQTSGPEYAAKSLSSIAIEARRLGQKSVELEWAQQAVELMPNDGVALGLLADTYLSLYRLEEARQMFEQSITYGEANYGQLGLGRVLTSSGQFKEALEIFEHLKSDIGDSAPESVFVWSSYCGTLKDMHHVQDAVSAGKQAVALFPNDVGTRCTYASSLSAAGELSSSLSEYQFAIDNLDGDIVALCGKASILGRMGSLDDALKEFKLVVERYPEEPLGYIGQANTLRDLGQFKSALDLYECSKELFPGDPRISRGYAETLKDMGRLKESISEYDSVIEYFPLDSAARNGRANALKASGKFKVALQAYELNVKDFPYDLFSLDGRADLLKRLGNYDEALVAYDMMIDRQPHFKRALVSKAAILVAMSRFSEAREILNADISKTEDDWVAIHILGMLALKENNLVVAEKYFRQGVDETPFYKQRIYFKTALAATLIRKDRFFEASQLVKAPPTDAAALILVHSLAALGKIPEALKNLEAMNDNLPPPIRELKSELCARFGLTLDTPIHSEDWINEQEIEVMLQAA